ncbi:MAG TPA: hypothetical protein VFB45_04960 [Pseudolabrys sp.]|nr:hypothetical protein [Pseudolabrys sp.]
MTHIRFIGLTFLLAAAAFNADARQAAPLLPALQPDAAGRVEIKRDQFISKDFAISVAAAAQKTHTDPALLFALMKRAEFASRTYGADAARDPTAPVGGPYAYGSAHWLRDLALYGKDAGYDEFAAAVAPLASGELAIADPDVRSRAMAARIDPYLSSFLAAKAWQRARKELGALRVPSDGLVMIAFVAGVRFAEDLAQRCNDNRTELLKKAVGDDLDVLLIMVGLPTRDGRLDAEWMVENFVDAITGLLRDEISAYSAARRINVPDDYRPPAS